MSNRPKPLLLMIPDGFGCRKEQDCNTLALANKPCRDWLQADVEPTMPAISGAPQPAAIAGQSPR